MNKKYPARYTSFCGQTFIYQLGPNQPTKFKVALLFSLKFWMVLVLRWNKKLKNYIEQYICILVAVGLSGILKGKQKLGLTFNSDKLGGIDFYKTFTTDHV